MSNDFPIHELDLAIPDMDSQRAESEVAALLKDVPGVIHVRLFSRGAFIRYRASAITPAAICELIRRAGFRASTFQDSASGRTGVSSQ